jgi:hypothetical protein
MYTEFGRQTSIYAADGEQVQWFLQARPGAATDAGDAPMMVSCWCSAQISYSNV